MSAQSSVILQRQLFLAQYTAVMLIVLTFVVGAFTGPRSKSPPPPPPKVVEEGTGTLAKTPTEITVSEPPLIGALTFTGVFNPDTNTLDPEQLGGVQKALGSHDIGVRLSVTSPSDDSSSAAMIARMVSAHRWLESLRLPKGAYQVEGVVSDAKDAPELTVSWFTEGAQ